MQQTLTLFCLKSFVICLTYGGSYSYSGFRFAFFSTTVKGFIRHSWFCDCVEFCIMSLVYSSLPFTVVTVLYSLYLSKLCLYVLKYY